MGTDETGVIEGEVRERLIGRARGAFTVREVTASLVEDPLGNDAWSVRLWIEPPSSGQWPIEVTSAFRDDARTAMNEVAYAHDALPGGATTVSVTAQAPDEQDVAPPDTPEPGEDPTASTKGTVVE